MYAEKPHSDKNRRQDTPLASRQRNHQTRVVVMAKPSPAPLAGKAPLLNPGLGVMQPKAMPFWAPAYSEKPHDPARPTVQLEKKPSAILPTPSQSKPSALKGAQAAAIALSRGSPVKSLLAGIATLSVAYLAPDVVKSVIQAIDDHPDLNPFQKETLKLYVYTMSVIQPDLFEGKKDQSEGNKNTSITTLPIAEQRPTNTLLPITEQTPTARSLPALDKDTLDYILQTPIADKIDESTQSVGKDSSEVSLGTVYNDKLKAILSNPTPDFSNKINDINCVDCDDIARYFYKAANGQGKILDLTVPGGEIKVFEFNNIENFVDHRVYSDGNYIYDPRYSSEPILFEKYISELKKINPELLIKDITPK